MITLLDDLMHSQGIRQKLVVVVPVTITTFSAIVGGSYHLFTHLVVREVDAQRLETEI